MKHNPLMVMALLIHSHDLLKGSISMEIQSDPVQYPFLMDAERENTIHQVNQN